MKRFFYVLTTVVAAMTISACNNIIEEEAPVIDGGNSANKITFTVSAEDDTRTALDLSGGEGHGQTTVWYGEEKMGLFYYYTPVGESEVKYVKNYAYTANASASAQATFTGEATWWDGEGAAEAAHKVYIYYPYSTDNDSKNASSVVGTLPAEQTYDATATYWDMSKYDFQYTNDNPATWGAPLEFSSLKRLFAVLRLGITNNTGEDVVIKKVTLSSEGGKILAGKFVVNLSKGKAENGLTNRTDAPSKEIHGSNTAYGYWTDPVSTITTEVSNGAVKDGEAIDVRFMLNAGYKGDDLYQDAEKDTPFFDATTPYLSGDTFTVTIVTNKGTHPEVSFKAGALLRGQRAGKSIVLEAVPAGEPNATSVVSNDSSEDKYYLNNTITITGTNLLNAQAVKVGGVAAEVVSQTGTELVVKVPDCTGSATTAADYDVTYTYNDAEGSFGKISVYPFYHYENMMLGCGSNSKNSYSEFASLNSFFYPDLGESVAVSKWKEDKLDKWALGDASYPTPVVHDSGNKYVNHDTSKISKEDYYSVLPYFFFITNSSHKFTLVTPCNSPNGLKCHFIDGVSVSTQSGTPNLWFRNMRTSNSAENKWYEAVKNGTITEMTAASYTGSMASAGAPEFKSASTDLSSQASQWHVGSVIMMQYVTYEKANKPSAMSDVAKLGFIYIKEVTCADLSTGKTLESREGHVKFDMYWSKKLN